MEPQNMIDRQLIFEITDGNQDLFDQMMELFVQISPDQLKLIRCTWEAADYHALRAAAHDVKSSASSIGGTILYESALQLEQSAKMKLDLTQILPMIIDVEDKVEKTISFYRDGKVTFDPDDL
ncbi:Hpt domain-containing protein [Spirochaeta isovalerica]|uniref:HPt (Histidine-containing phosphotransfer) domain-containing protein n=1 Tax=Spirochaeta isovalerica TaxID=150 RepID=A0A841R770_9SPIO|nr:Hpt domain-containing protein [Spirochaeta isovalerica]MBB6478608.1 HPt (histidine-containing phosphotransfer) domain-containing protein [Spirochaeta isovalerica]